MEINVNAQQMAFNYVEINAGENAQSKIIVLFDDYMKGKSRKLGGIFLLSFSILFQSYFSYKTIDYNNISVEKIKNLRFWELEEKILKAD